MDENGLTDLLLRYFIFLQNKHVGAYVTQHIVTFLTQFLSHEHEISQNELLLELMSVLVSEGDANAQNDKPAEQQ